MIRKPTAIIRTAVLNDSAGVVRVHIDCWRSTYAGIVPARYLSRLSYQVSEDSWRKQLSVAGGGTSFFVAEESGQIVGFACGGAERSGQAIYKGELYAIYIQQEHRRKGNGARLTKALVGALLAEDISSMLVWVLADNPHKRFYEALDGSKIDEKTITIGGTDLLELAYGWKDIRPLLYRDG